MSQMTTNEVEQYYKNIYKAFDIIAEQAYLAQDAIKKQSEAYATLLAQQGTTTVENTTSQPEPVVPQTAKPTAQEMQKRLTEFILKDQEANQAKLAEIFTKYGVKKFSDINEADYPALLADIEAA